MANYETKMWHIVNSQSVQNNSSTITVYFAFRRTDYPYSGYNNYGNALWSMECAGQHKRTDGWTFNYSSTYDWITIGSKSFTVSHSSDGSKYVNYSAYAFFDVNPAELWFSGGGWLPKIPRYTSIASWDTYEISDTYLRLNWTANDTISELKCYLNSSLKYSYNPNNKSGSFTIGELKENTNYNLYIVVKRKDSGLETTSWTINKTTAFSIPNITKWACTKQEINALVLNWACDYNCRNIKVYNNNTLIYERNINQSSGTIRLDPTNFFNISPNTTYSLKIEATRSYGDNIAYSNYVNIKTLPYTMFDTSQSSFSIGDSVTLTFKNHENSNSTLSFYAIDEVGSRTPLQDSVRLNAGVGSYTFTPSASKLYSLCPYHKYIKIIIRCSVTWNSVEYYTEYTSTGNCVEANCIPSFTSFSFLNTDVAIANVIGTQNMINNCGNLRVVIPIENSAVPKNGAKISSYKLDISYYDTSYTYYIPLSTLYIDVGSLSSNGNYVLKVSAIDSRGYVTSVTKSLNVYLYHKPSYVVEAKRFNDFENQILLDLRCYISKVMIGTIQKNNFVQLKYKKWPVSTSEPDTFTTITVSSNTISPSANDNLVSIKMNSYNGGSGIAGVDYFISLDNSTSYYIKFYITDTISNEYLDDSNKYTTYLMLIDAGVPVLGIFEDGRISVGKNPSFDVGALLQIASDISIQDKLGNSGCILDNIIKVQTNEPPNQFVGGLWFDED